VWCVVIPLTVTAPCVGSVVSRGASSNATGPAAVASVMVDGAGQGGIDMNGMKQPEIKNCPCCGVECSVPNRTAPICVQPGSTPTYIEEYIRLVWRCTMCGCRWEHGQFSKPATTEAAEGGG
jgi:hypothetical protein